MQATQLTSVSVSHREIIISFTPGVDGGFPQTVSTELSVTSSDESFVSYNRMTLGLSNVSRVEMIVARNLSASTGYNIRVKSDNAFEGDAVNSQQIVVTTRGKLQILFTTRGKLQILVTTRGKL